MPCEQGGKEVITTSGNDINLPREETRRSQKRVTFALVLSLLLGAGILAALLALTHVASAQPAPGEQIQDTSSVSDASNSPDCSPTWLVVSSPNVGTGENVLYGIAAVSSNDIWVVGYYVTTSRTRETLIQRWNGTSWNTIPSPNVGTQDNSLNGVAALSSTDIWAVGSYLSGSVVKTLIEHWNGAAWSMTTSPNPTIIGDNSLNGVAAVSATNIWAVGKSFNASFMARTLIRALGWYCLERNYQPQLRHGIQRSQWGGRGIGK